MHTCANKTGGNISHLEQMVNSFLPYSQEQLGFDKPVKIVFQSDPSNADVLLGKTAHYDPQRFEVYLYTDKRHPKDIMRSLSHELVHHAQNCRGDFGNCEDTGPGYAQRNPHLRKMEREAYTKGNLIFRDFEDLIKRGKITIDINFKDSGEPQISLKILATSWSDLRCFSIPIVILEFTGIFFYPRPILYLELSKCPENFRDPHTHYELDFAGSVGS